jgi:hypothetical protein
LLDLVAARATGLGISRMMAALLVDGEYRKALPVPLIHFLRRYFRREVVVADRVLVLPVVVENDELELLFFFHLFLLIYVFMLLRRVEASRAIPARRV